MSFFDENQKLFKVNGLVGGEENGEKNFEILQKALTECLSGGFSGLALPKGVYQIYNQKAIYLFANIHYKDFYNFYNNQREFKHKFFYNHLILF